MPDRVSPARPAAHRRGLRHRRSPAEQFIYEQMRTAAVLPLAVLTVVLAAAVITWRTGLVPAAPLAACGGCGLVAALAVGLWRAQTAAGAVCRRRVADVERLIAGVDAVGARVRFTAEELRQGHTPPVPPCPTAPEDDGSYAGVGHALERLRVLAAGAVIEAHEQSQLAVRHAMFRHIAQREHTLVSRLLEALADLQNQIKAAGLLDRVFRIDNMAVRVRRLVESLAILGGESASTVRHPVTLTTVLRGAVQEVEQYERARVVTTSYDPRLSLPGHIAPDVTHLLAELIENATEFSGPATQVWVRADLVAAGLAIEIEDRAERPMPRHMRDQMNALLAQPHLVDVNAQLADGRIGLLVVGMTAQRHGIHVTLTSNPAGGTTALIVIPARLLVTAEPDPVLELTAPSAPAHQARPVPAPTASTASGLPQRARHPALVPTSGPPDGPRRQLPVRRRTAQPDTGLPDQDTADPAPVTSNPGLAGAFRKGAQLSQQHDTPAPRHAPDQ
jgi:signal transduction histidine kinase